MTQKNYRGIIKDELLDKNIYTKRCMTEEDAKEESKKAIERLCKKFKVEKTDSRFIFEGIQF